MYLIKLAFTLVLLTYLLYSDDYVKLQKESFIKQIKQVAQKDNIDLAYQNIKLKQYINHQEKVIEEQNEQIKKLKELLKRLKEKKNGNK